MLTSLSLEASLRGDGWEIQNPIARTVHEDSRAPCHACWNHLSGWICVRSLRLREQVGKWTSDIVESAVKKLTDLQKPFKYVGASGVGFAGGS